MRALFFVLGLLPALVSGETVDVYFGTGGGQAKGIYHATLDARTGMLSSPTLAAEIDRPVFLAMNAQQTRLYAVARITEPVVAAYAIEPSGALRMLNSTPIGDGGAAHISVHPEGKFLMTAQYGRGSVAVFPIREDGSVGRRSQLIEHSGGSKVVVGRQDGPHPHWTGFSADGAYAFVPDLGLDQVLIYAVDDADGLTLAAHGHAQSVAGGGPRHMRFSVDGRFIYLLNELSLSVTTFAYDAAAGTAMRLTTTQALSDAVKANEAFNSASEILVHPNGRFVYSANRGNDSVTVYEADSATGELTVREVEPIRGSWPRHIGMDPSGRWLLAAGAHSNTVSVFAVNADSGELTFQTRMVRNVPRAICILLRRAVN